MEEPKRMHRCCFTGHRPEKLNMSESEVKERLKKAIREAIKDGFTTFITGMARGVDMWAGEIVLEERKNNDRIKLICASPFESFEKSWDIVEKKRYNKIMEQADYVKFVCEHYSRSCFQIRNCFMVDNSARVISAYNGEKGGTRNTIKYATSKNVDVVNIFDERYA